MRGAHELMTHDHGRGVLTRATAHDVDRRLEPAESGVVRGFSRRRSNARLASRGEDDRTEGSWSFLLVFAIERGRREDDGRWTRETRERERERRGELGGRESTCA